MQSKFHNILYLSRFVYQLPNLPKKNYLFLPQFNFRKIYLTSTYSPSHKKKLHKITEYIFHDNQQGFCFTTTRVQNFIKILYLPRSLNQNYAQSSFHPLDLILKKIFPRTKLFRPELNRKRKVPLAFQIKKKKKLPQDYRIYSRTKNCA